MGFLDWFRRPPPIADRNALADFLDSRAAFLSQKSIFDYARGRAGPYFTIIMKEKVFQELVEIARWKNYPYGLSIVAEMVHGVLLPEVHRRLQLVSALRETALHAFDRYPSPEALGAEVWGEERKALALRCDQVGLHPPKPVKDIPIPFAQCFFDNMPIHERLREHDFELIRNQLRVNLISMHRDFVKRAHLTTLADDLTQGADEATS
jgi:hypothetical protein